MQRHAAFFTMLLVVLASACSQAPPTTDEAYAQLRDAYNEAETPEAKIVICEQFLTEHPAAEAAPRILDTAVYHLQEEIGDLPKARALVEQTIAKVDDPEITFQMKMTLWELANDMDQPIDLEPIGAELAAHRSLEYRELSDLLEASVKGESWQLADSYATQALALATPAAYRADYPDRELEDAEVAKRAAFRRCNALSYGGWALYRLGRVEEAMAAFQEADPLLTSNYVGIPDTKLYRLWGQAALEEGDLERAEQLLTPDAIMAHHDKSMAGLEQVYAAKNGSSEGFDDYLWEARQRLVRTIDDFSLPTYDDTPVSLSSLSGKVVLLNFWFPT